VGCGDHSDGAVFGFFLDLLYQVSAALRVREKVVGQADTLKRVLQGKKFNLPV